MAYLVEYALGSQAGVAASRAETILLRENGVLRMRFLSRNDDPGLTLAVETSIDLAANHWIASAHPVVKVASLPTPAPSGFDWLQVDLPDSDGRNFARVRVTLIP